MYACTPNERPTDTETHAQPFETYKATENSGSPKRRPHSLLFCIYNIYACMYTNTMDMHIYFYIYTYVYIQTHIHINIYINPVCEETLGLLHVTENTPNVCFVFLQLSIKVFQQLCIHVHIICACPVHILLYMYILYCILLKLNILYTLYIYEIYIIYYIFFIYIIYIIYIIYNIYIYIYIIYIYIII